MEYRSGFNKLILWLGVVSYSLYLVHWEAGRRGVTIARHIPALGTCELFKVLIGLIISLIAAYLLYRFVEKPSIKYSGKIKYATGDPKPGILGQV